MIEVWPQADKLAKNIIEKLKQYTPEELKPDSRHESDNFTWENYIWTSDKCRLDFCGTLRCRRL